MSVTQRSSACPFFFCLPSRDRIGYKLRSPAQATRTRRRSTLVARLAALTPQRRAQQVFFSLSARLTGTTISLARVWVTCVCPRRVPSESDQRSTLVVGSRRPSTCALACAALGEPRQRLRWFAALFATEPLPDLEHLYRRDFFCHAKSVLAPRTPHSAVLAHLWPTLASRCQGLPVHLTTTDP